MKFLPLFSMILLAFCSHLCTSINSKLLEIETSFLSDVMKSFMTRIIQENSQEKNGYLFVAVNKVEAEYSDFATKQLNKYSAVIVLNFYQDRDIEFELNPHHFKFAVTDPEDDLSNSGEIFQKIKVSRARVVLILTKKPLPIIVDYILNSYWKVRSINIIIAYESEGSIEIITYNPYLPTSKKVENLTNSVGNLFYDKTRNLYGSTVKCLLPYRDRTKIKRVSTSSGYSYEGKDYIAIHTLIKHLNGEIRVLTMENVLLNPWFESLMIPNKTSRKKKVLIDKDISVLIKSEEFDVDDEVLDNLYPHAQNDLCSLAPKSSEIPMGVSMTMIYTPSVWVANFFLMLVVLMVWIAIKKSLGNDANIQKLSFDIYRMIIANNIFPFPKLSLERVLILSYLFTFFVINMFLQSKVTSILAIRKYYPEINTIEELFSSGLPLYSISTHIIEVKKKYFGSKYELYAESLIPLGSNEGLMDQMTYRADVAQMPAFLTEHDIALFVSRCKNFRKNGAQVYHLVKESIIPKYQSYKVIHNSPLLPILNKKLRRLEEAGFIELWAKRTIFNATIDGFLYPEDDVETGTAKPLSLNVTMIWFQFLILGLSVSTVAFIAELVWHKIFETKPKFMYLN